MLEEETYNRDITSGTCYHDNRVKASIMVEEYHFSDIIFSLHHSHLIIYKCSHCHQTVQL